MRPLLLSALLLSAPAAAAEKITTFVLDFESKDASIPVSAPSLLSGLVAAHLGGMSGLEVSSAAEFKSLVALEGDKALAGCEDSSCLAELANSMGARLIVLGELGKLGSFTMLNLSLYDHAHAKTVARESMRGANIDEIITGVGAVLDRMASKALGAPVASATPASPAAANLLRSAASGPGTWRRLGPPKAWANTRAAVAHGGALFTVEASGNLYTTEIATGAWRAVGTAVHAGTRWLFSAKGGLVALDERGGLFVIDAKTGERRRLGVLDDVIAAVVRGGLLFWVDKTGVLRRTELKKGRSKVVGKAEFAATRFLVAGHDALYSIEEAGNLYRIAGNGSWRQVGPTGGWRGTQAASSVGSTLYTVEKSGGFYRTDLSTGKWKQLGKPDFAATVFLVAFKGDKDDTVRTIETDGSLYRVNVR